MFLITLLSLNKNKYRLNKHIKSKSNKKIKISKIYEIYIADSFYINNLDF
jgi:hypothetical protein